ncbi:MAG TPA: ABC transporter ATP-binding protein [Acidimicrobiia bacterium]|nr:ABC transporter ATP-binding protein [Acidimicrobiia bacterium]
MTTRREDGSASVVVSDHIVVMDDVSRDYVTPGYTVHALRNVSLAVDHGQMVAVRGRSGSGKTTLLNMIGGLDHPTTGRVEVTGVEVTGLAEPDLVRMRRDHIGYIFQAFGLVPILTAAENVEIPMRLVAMDPKERRGRSRVLLELVGLSDRANHRPHELSGGEQQRVAIARSLANRPSLLLADEPTGQLDSHTGRSIMNLILAVAHSEDVAVIVATHDPAFIDLADRLIDLHDGEVVGDSAA